MLGFVRKEIQVSEVMQLAPISALAPRQLAWCFNTHKKKKKKVR